LYPDSGHKLLLNKNLSMPRYSNLKIIPHKIIIWKQFLCQARAKLLLVSWLVLNPKVRAFSIFDVVVSDFGSSSISGSIQSI
jgi:hypothetical protein